MNDDCASDTLSGENVQHNNGPHKKKQRSTAGLRYLLTPDELEKVRERDRDKKKRQRLKNGRGSERLANKRWYAKNKEKVKELNAAWYAKNREKACLDALVRRRKNPDLTRLREKEKNERVNKDPERAQRRRDSRKAYVQKRLKEDVCFALIKKARGRILSALSRKKTAKINGTIVLVGCTKEHLRLHLEKQFQRGMTWNNHGIAWHIDHIIPCSSFDFSREDEQKKCFHFSNLRPLRKSENLMKGDKIINCQPELALSML